MIRIFKQLSECLKYSVNVLLKQIYIRYIIKHQFTKKKSFQGFLYASILKIPVGLVIAHNAFISGRLLFFKYF